MKRSKVTKQTKGSKMSKKSNTAQVETSTVSPVQPAGVIERDDKGRIKTITMSMDEWADIMKAKSLKSKSAMIRYLAGSGYSPSAISKFMNVRYQHVRNVLTQVLKKPSTSNSDTGESATGE